MTDPNPFGTISKELYTYFGNTKKNLEKFEKIMLKRYNPDKYLRESGRIEFNRDLKQTTVLLLDGQREALVRCLDGVEFDLRKGIEYAILRWIGIGGNDIWNKFVSFTYVRTTHKGQKTMRVIFTEDFLKHLIVNKYELSQEELDELYEKVLDPDTYDPEQLYLELILSKKFNITQDTIDKLMAKAKEHHTQRKPKLYCQDAITNNYVQITQVPNLTLSTEPESKPKRKRTTKSKKESKK